MGEAGRLSLARRTLLASLLASPALAACQRTRIADLPLRLVESYPIVPAVIAGRLVSLLLDTGAQGMLLTPAIAEALRLPLVGTTRIYGTGGSQDVRVVRVAGLRLGGVAMPDQLSPVAPLPLVLAMEPPLAGLLGASLLSRFDLELDVPAARVTLWSPGECPLPPGTHLPLDISRAGEAFCLVNVNGQPLLAQLDTGSRATILTTQTARRLGLGAPISANTAAGVDGERLPSGHAVVRLALGKLPAADTPVTIAPIRLERGDLLLGLDVLARFRVFIGYAQGVLVLNPV